MIRSLKLASRLLAATLVTAGLLLPAVASAQYGPPPPPGQQPYPPPQPYPQQPYGQQPYGPPSYAQPQEETIHGRVYSINGTFNITVTDDNGYMDNVELHQGTIINPTGLTLAPGMEVTIEGYNAGAAFEANEIDTPYTYSGPLPVPVYYGPGWWYPGFAYGYGPSFGLSFVFFNGGYRIERGAFNRNLWVPRADVRYRGSNGYNPRYRSSGTRTYNTGNNHAYVTTTRPEANRVNYGTSTTHANWYSPATTTGRTGANSTGRNNGWNGNANANGANYSSRNNGGTTASTHAQPQSRPANTGTRSTQSHDGNHDHSH
jgi:hypothetical protein